MTYFDEFQIYESTNFVIEKCLYFFYRSCNVSFFEKKTLVLFSNIFDLNKKILPGFKRKQAKFREKNCGFVDSEIVKTC